MVGEDVDRDVGLERRGGGGGTEGRPVGVTGRNVAASLSELPDHSVSDGVVDVTVDPVGEMAMGPSGRACHSDRGRWDEVDRGPASEDPEVGIGHGGGCDGGTGGPDEEDTDRRRQALSGAELSPTGAVPSGRGGAWYRTRETGSGCRFRARFPPAPRRPARGSDSDLPVEVRLGRPAGDALAV